MRRLFKKKYMKLRLLKEEELPIFIHDIQESFQKGYEDYFGKTEDIIIPERDILESYNTKGAKAYVMVDEDKIVGGAIVVIDDVTNRNYLHILYVKVGYQSKGIGLSIWNTIEKLYPNTISWGTCTPYFDERNIHFYVNKCGFHIVEFINKYHHQDEPEEDFIGDHGEGMFEFEKVMKKGDRNEIK